MGMLPRRGVRARLRLGTALAGAGALTAALLFAPVAGTADTAPPSGSNLPATVSADALPTVQQNGVVWAQVLVGNTVYATGDFSETWPAGQSESSSTETPRADLLAYDITTGELTSFSHTLNAQGLGIAASPDGSTVYVVGDFTQVDGKTHNHIVAFDTSTGEIKTTFQASISGEARAVTATNSTVYAGGTFTQAGGMTRTRLASFTASAGALTSWAPTADNQVDALALSSDGSRVLIGGRFVALDGTNVYGLGSVDPNGTLQTFAINGIIQDASADPNTGGECGITSLTVSGDVVYGTAFSYGCGDFEGRFAASTDKGTPIWIDDCHGDSYGTAPVGQVLYSVSHAHDCSAVGSFPDKSAPGGNQRALAETTFATGTDSGPDAYGWNYSGQPDATILQWFPKLAPGTVTGQNQAAWSVVGNSSYIALGGEFPSVNGVAQAGLVRFAIGSIAANKVGPMLSSGLTPTASSNTTGVVNLSWTATWDQDNADLTYAVKRIDGTTVTTVATLHEASTFWQLPTMTFTDTGLTPGSTPQYYITVTDPLGNKISGDKSDQVTVSSTGTAPPASGPVASFSSTCTQATCSFDASASSDSDGTISSYDWDFGDSTVDKTSGATVSHTYTTSGQHTVTLEVSDGTNPMSSVAQNVTTVPPPSKLVAQDTFARSMASGWGDADQGGVWRPSSGCGNLSVKGKTGYVVARRAQACSVYLSAVSTPSTDTTTAITATTRPKGGIYFGVIGRRVSASNDVRLQLHVLSTGHVQAELLIRTASTQQVIGKPVTLSGTFSANTKLMVRLQVTGMAPTVVKGKVWTGSTQPKSWTLSASTSATKLQHLGSIAVAAYLPTSKNPTTATVRVYPLTTKIAS